MTALEAAKQQAAEIIAKKKKAIADKSYMISYQYNSAEHHMYYHSGRWNDRPATVGQYRTVL